MFDSRRMKQLLLLLSLTLVCGLTIPGCGSEEGDTPNVPNTPTTKPADK